MPIGRNGDGAGVKCPQCSVELKVNGQCRYCEKFFVVPRTTSVLHVSGERFNFDYENLIQSLRAEVAALRGALNYVLMKERTPAFQYDEFMELAKAAMAGGSAPGALENEQAKNKVLCVAMDSLRREMKARVVEALVVLHNKKRPTQ